MEQIYSPYFEAVMRMAPERIVNVSALTRLTMEAFPDKLPESDRVVRRLATEFIDSRLSQQLDFARRDLAMQLRPVSYTLILPDIHRPFHNKFLWDKILDFIQWLGPQLKTLILSGDFLDLYTLGSYNADSLGLLTAHATIDGKRIMDLDEEYKDGRKGIAELESVLPEGCKKVYLYGNHEDRYFREINKGDKSKYGAALKSPTEALLLKENGWEVYHSWQEDSYDITDDLEVIHGIFCNIHTAKKHVDEFDNSIIFGHTHRFQTFGSTGGKSGYNIGWLGDQDHKVFRYMYKKARYKKWQNGFCLVGHDEEGSRFVEPIACRDNKFFYAGQVW